LKNFCDSEAIQEYNSILYSYVALRSGAPNSKWFLYNRGVKLIFTEGHINIMVALKGRVVTELTIIIYATLMLKERLCDNNGILQW